MTLEDSIHSQRLRVLRAAEQLANVSEACRRHGMSRTLFYRLRRLKQHYASAPALGPRSLSCAGWLTRVPASRLRSSSTVPFQSGTFAKYEALAMT